MSALLNTGTWKRDDIDGATCVTSPKLETECFVNSWKHPKKEAENGSLGKIDIPCPTDNGIRTPGLDCNTDALGACSSPSPVTREMQTPLTKLSNTSSSKEWLLDSGIKPETVEQQCKFRRLRKHGDINRNISTESRNQTGPSDKFKTSRRTDHHKSTKLLKGHLISFLSMKCGLSFMIQISCHTLV